MRKIPTDSTRARWAVKNAIRYEHLKRLPCQVCGRKPADAHHYLGYARENWLKVQWLCDYHHHEADLKLRGLELKQPTIPHGLEELIDLLVIWVAGKPA